MSYPGTGKYKDSNLYVPFHELPDTEEIASEEQLQITSPPGQGWWPVIVLGSVTEASVKKVLVVWCYQLLSDGRVFCWWIFL